MHVEFAVVSVSLEGINLAMAYEKMFEDPSFLRSNILETLWALCSHATESQAAWNKLHDSLLFREQIQPLFNTSNPSNDNSTRVILCMRRL